VNATSIAYSAAREKSSVPSNDCVLVVGVPEAASSPGRLEAVQTECDDLKARFGDRAEVLIGPNATRERIVRNLSEHAFVHFACRGHVSSSNPAASALLLYDHPLSVQDIASLQLDGELAFLSACNTALGSEGLPDETIHIAAALQVAGIRHVIATFWTILDSAASSVTQVMYEELALSGAPAADDVARRVHSALLKIRSTYEDRTSIWSTYAHFGV
jgi:CHAT domain-containing protein